MNKQIAGRRSLKEDRSNALFPASAETRGSAAEAFDSKIIKGDKTMKSTIESAIQSAMDDETRYGIQAFNENTGEWVAYEAPTTYDFWATAELRAIELREIFSGIKFRIKAL